RLASLGLLATTNPMGAGKWRSEYNEWLRGRKVVIFPDNDEPGRNHARQVADSLTGVATSVKLVELPGLPEKGDVSDWLAISGDDKNALVQKVEQTSEWEKKSQAPEENPFTLSEEEKETLAGIHELLETGGAEALFRNELLLKNLARLQLNNPAEFAAVRA